MSFCYDITMKSTEILGNHSGFDSLNWHVATTTDETKAITITIEQFEIYIDIYKKA